MMACSIASHLGFGIVAKAGFLRNVQADAKDPTWLLADEEIIL